ncbi:MAG: hypothetical protein ABJA11_09450 [Pseudolysinimonas sp.]
MTPSHKTLTSLTALAVLGGACLLLSGCSLGPFANWNAGGATSGAAAGSSATSSPSASSGSSGSSTGGASNLDARCAVIKKSDLAAMFTTNIGPAHNLIALMGSSSNDPAVKKAAEISMSCWYGVGPSAGFSFTSAAAQPSDDTLLVSSLRVGGKRDYDDKISSESQLTTFHDVPGLGDKASWATDVSDSPTLYAYQGDMSCQVQFHVSKLSEIGLPDRSIPLIDASQAPAIAAKEVALCADVFAGK